MSRKKKAPTKKALDSGESVAPDTLTITSRKDIRQQLNDDIEAFLASGGEIDYIDPNITTQPPSKPVTNYGSRPI